MIIRKPSATEPAEYYDDAGNRLPDDHIDVVAMLTAMAETENLQVTAIPTLDPVIVSARRMVCNSCDMFNSETDRCRACGCGDHMGRRVQSPFAKCPLDRWSLQFPVTQ